MNSPRTLFFGYSEVGYATLERLLARKVNVIGVLTHADDPGETAWFRSVPKLAAQNRLPVFTPESLKDPAWEERIRELKPDLILSMYYRHLIAMRLLNLARLGAFNMHGSYLPRYRGRAPLNWAIINGEDHTGVTLHVMVKEADAGDIVDQEKIFIGSDEPVGNVVPRVRDAAVLVLDRQLDALLAGQAPRRPQDHAQATYFGKRTPEDGRINWRLPARAVFNLVRGVTRPFPGAFTDLKTTNCTARLKIWWGTPVESDGKPFPAGTVTKLKPLTIACGKDFLEVSDYELIIDGKSPENSLDETLREGDIFGL